MTETRIFTDHEATRSDGTTVRYTVSGLGEGEAWVFVHGWGCGRHDFDALISYLPPTTRAIAVDLAEHGDSRSTRASWTMREFALDVAAVLEKESVEKAVAIGHSMGGAVVVELARLLPGVVTEVVGIDSLHYLALFPSRDAEETAEFMRPFQEDFAGAVRAMVEAGSPEGFDPSLTDAYFRRMVATRQPAGIGALEGLAGWDMEAALRDLRQPVTVMAVRDLLEQEAIDRYGDWIEFLPVDLGSHHFPVENPAGTARILLDLLADRAA